MLIPTGDTSFNGIIEGNSTFGSIVHQLQNNVSEEQIIEALLAHYNAKEEIIRKDVNRAIKELKNAGAIDD